MTKWGGESRLPHLAWCPPPRYACAAFPEFESPQESPMRSTVRALALALFLGLLAATPASAGQIVYSSNDNIHVANDDGSGVRTLLTPADVPGATSLYNVHVDPNGTKVVFSARTPHNGGIFCGFNCVGVYALDGNSLSRVSGAPIGCSGDPCLGLDVDPKITADGNTVFYRAGLRRARRCLRHAADDLEQLLRPGRVERRKPGDGAEQGSAGYGMRAAERLRPEPGEPRRVRLRRLLAIQRAGEPRLGAQGPRRPGRNRDHQRRRLLRAERHRLAARRPGAGRRRRRRRQGHLALLARAGPDGSPGARGRRLRLGQPPEQRQPDLRRQRPDRVPLGRPDPDDPDELRQVHGRPEHAPARGAGQRWPGVDVAVGAVRPARRWRQQRRRWQQQWRRRPDDDGRRRLRGLRAGPDQARHGAAGPEDPVQGAGRGQALAEGDDRREDGQEVQAQAARP